MDQVFHRAVKFVWGLSGARFYFLKCPKGSKELDLRRWLQKWQKLRLSPSPTLSHAQTCQSAVPRWACIWL